MKLIQTSIDGVFIIEPSVFKDDRGYFFESYNLREFQNNGLNYQFVQTNQSQSVYGTVRGLHFQTGEDAQAKLVRVLLGRVLDVAVDLRKNSETFGQHVAVELTEDNHRELLIPRGFAHGFSVLSEKAVFAYQCDNFYAPKSEASIRFDDPDIDIDWKIEASKIILSQKDLKANSFAQYCLNPMF